MEEKYVYRENFSRLIWTMWDLNQFYEIFEFYFFYVWSELCGI